MQYDLIFKRALEKLRTDYNSGEPDHSPGKLVYCRISSATDSEVNSLFESYAQMKIGPDGINDYQPSISRYASENDNIPGLKGNKLEFNIDPYINLPIMAERFISRRGYIMKDSNQVAVIRIDLDNTINTYYINVADTSVLYILSKFTYGKKGQIPGIHEVWQKDRVHSAEISFSHTTGSTENYFIDWSAVTEEFNLIRKDKPLQHISEGSFFAVVPDSSIIRNAVRDEVSHNEITELRRQINFRGKLSLSRNSLDFESETGKLLMKPYRSGFWTRNSYMLPDLHEQKQIAVWERGNMFYSQDRLPPAKESICADSLVNLMNKNIVAVENVYVETDRQDYLAGDTIWFSAFVLDNLHMDSTSLSRILYVDLINADNTLDKHLKLIITNGRTHGDFVINKDSRNGICRLRAYTQYMRNFQGEYLFEKEIPVHESDFTKMILLNPVIKRSIEGDSVELKIKTILPDEYQIEDKKLEVIARLNDTLSVRKTFNVKKSINESMGFFVPTALSCRFVDIRLILSGKTVISEQRQSIPLRSGINLQFFPESGKMVAGIATIIACKATDDRGYPAKFEADIVDENNNKIIHISGNDSGVGSFEFTPGISHSYRSLVNKDGSKYFSNLPIVEPTGYILNFNADSGDIIIKNNLNDLNEKYYLLFAVRGAVYKAIETKLDFRPLKIHLPLEMYPKGIIQVTLYDSLYRPLAERLVFNNRKDQKMFIHVETDKKTYNPRDKVTLTINVDDLSGNPVTSSLSVAVEDESKSDSTISRADIESYLYLTSELKGRIDYSLLNLSDTTSIGNAKRDLVMMTQGWRNYLWNSIRYTDSYRTLYPVEAGFCINGSVYNIRNQQSFSGYKLNYLDFKSGINDITTIDENNKFKIDIPFFYNSHTYFIQNKNNKNRIKNLGFVLDTLPCPYISYRNNELPYVSYRASFTKAIDKKFSEIDSTNNLINKYIKIPEVKITAKLGHTGYSNPTKTVNLVKTDPTGQKYSSLFQMINDEFGEKAFTATGYGTHSQVHYPIIVVNGAPLTAPECPPCYDFDAYEWANSIPVREISDVKFYEAESTYSQWLSPPPPDKKYISRGTYAKNIYFIVAPRIYLPVVSLKTAHSYRGNPRGAIVFTFQGIYKAREFYQPDYENKNIEAPDNRTTIYWNPEIQTDSTGTAKVSFYNSDLKGKALIRISGVSYSLKNASTSLTHYLSK